MKKFIIRLYAAHDADLIYASCNPCITFSNFICMALTCFIKNEPLDTALWEKEYEISSIRSKQITLYLDETKDAPVIDLLNSASCINSLVKGILRLYLTHVCGLKTISKVYLSGKISNSDKNELKPKKNPNALLPKTQKSDASPTESVSLPNNSETVPKENISNTTKEEASPEPVNSTAEEEGSNDVITYTASNDSEGIDVNAESKLFGFLQY